MGRHDGSWRKGCAVKARDKAGLCPGCGERIGEHGLQSRGICADCLDAIDCAGKARTKPVRWYSLDAAGFFSYLSDSEEAGGVATRRAVQELAQALSCNERRYLPNGRHDGVGSGASQIPQSDRGGGYEHPRVELDEDQAAHLTTLAGLLYQIVESARRRGVDQGSSLLRRLATGEKTVNDFEDLRREHTAEVPDFDKRCHMCNVRSIHGKADHEHAIRVHVERALAKASPAVDE